jgi:hypothetical protein
MKILYENRLKTNHNIHYIKPTAKVKAMKQIEKTNFGRNVLSQKVISQKSLSH